MKVSPLVPIASFVYNHKSSSQSFVAYWKWKAAQWISEDIQHPLGCENATKNRCCWAQFSLDSSHWECIDLLAASHHWLILGCQMIGWWPQLRHQIRKHNVRQVFSMTAGNAWIEGACDHRYLDPRHAMLVQVFVNNSCTFVCFCTCCMIVEKCDNIEVLSVSWQI